MPAALPARCPRMSIGGAITVAIPIVAMPAWSARCIGFNGCINHRERLGDRRIVERLETKAHQFQEASVDHRALIERGTAITQIIADRCIWIACLRETNKVGM